MLKSRQPGNSWGQTHLHLFCNRRARGKHLCEMLCQSRLPFATGAIAHGRVLRSAAVFHAMSPEQSKVKVTVHRKARVAAQDALILRPSFALQRLGALSSLAESYERLLQFAVEYLTTPSAACQCTVDFGCPYLLAAFDMQALLASSWLSFQQRFD